MAKPSSPSAGAGHSAQGGQANGEPEVGKYLICNNDQARIYIAGRYGSHRVEKAIHFLENEGGPSRNSKITIVLFEDIVYAKEDANPNSISLGLHKRYESPPLGLVLADEAQYQSFLGLLRPLEQVSLVLVSGAEVKVRQNLKR